MLRGYDGLTACQAPARRGDWSGWPDSNRRPLDPTVSTGQALSSPSSSSTADFPSDVSRTINE